MSDWFNVFSASAASIYCFCVVPQVPELFSDSTQCFLSCPSVVSVDLPASPVNKKKTTNVMNRRRVISSHQVTNEARFPAVLPVRPRFFAHNRTPSNG